MPNPSLIPGERSVRHKVVIPESLDRKLRARAILDGDRKISEVIREAIEAYLDNAPGQHDAPDPRRP